MDESLQLSIYALACRDALGLGTPEKVTLYFTESALRLSTTRTDEQLDAARADVLARVSRMRAGEFVATPGDCVSVLRLRPDVSREGWVRGGGGADDCYQAKGLEHEVVVVLRLVEGQFPDTRAETQLIPKELLKQEPPPNFEVDEERRLLFVAMTRAKSRLILTTSAGPTGKPSRFLEEVETGAANDVTVWRRETTVDAEVEESAPSAEECWTSS